MLVALILAIDIAAMIEVITLNLWRSSLLSRVVDSNHNGY